MDVISYVDSGKSPDEYLQEVIDSCENTINLSKGKLNAIQILRETIDKELKEKVSK